MACLGDLIRSSLRSGSKAKITTLHKYIFESEGDRSNRQRLRAFCGFAYNESSAEFEVKSRYVDANLSERDLVTICNVLGIDYNVADVKLHIFHNLQKGRLLVASGAENHDDDDDNDDDGVGSEDEAANSYDGAEQRACSTLRNRRNDDCFFSIDGNEGRKEAHKTAERRERRRICDEREASISASEVNENEMPMQMSRFAINFRDIEDSVRPFDGTDKLPIDVWVNEFEETATLMRWDEFQKFVFAKKSLKGLARMFILSERGITSWCKLKKALIDEFQAVVNSAHLHKQLTERKMKREENVQEYFFCMKELAARGNIEENALIQYVIDGIRDMSVSKTVLYGAKNIREFKEKLRCYEGIREKMKTDDTKEIGKKGMVNKTERNELKCYNCGAKGHKSVNCESREKGTKCFQCNEYGHIAKNCTNNKSLNKGAQRNTRLITGKRSIMNKDVIMNDKKLIALFDTGSKFSLITESVYNVLNKPYLKECNISLYGFGECDTKNAVKPMGALKYKIEIDGEIYELEFLVVPSKFLDCEVIIGENFCAYAEVKIDREGLHVKKVENGSDDNSKFFMMKIDIAADEKEIDIGEMVQIGSKQKVRDMVKTYQPNKQKFTNVEMKIILKDESPIFSRPRRLPIAEKLIVDSQVEQWLSDGIIEASDSEFCSPVVLVKKRDGTPRLCIDFRRLNKVMIKDHFPLPLIEDQLDQLQNAKIFSTIDLRNGFFHVSIAESSHKYTAFVTHNGQYQFLKVPFGLSNSPSVFQRHINAIFRDLVRRGTVLLYMDDVIIPAQNEESALKNLEEVMQVCKDYGLDINFKKCQFLKTKVEFLGHVVENQKLSPSPEKIEAVTKYKIPQNLKQLQGFLGLAGYFRKFVRNFSVIAKPLSDLTKQNVKFEMKDREIESFQTLKKCLSEKPVLSIFNQKFQTEVHTDASIDGYGAVLLQKLPEDGHLHPIYYMSKKTTEAERKYTSYELEVLAVIEALKKFRVYLLGLHFKLVTDCNAFTKTLDKKDLCTRVARWILFLQEYDYEVEHRAGTQMRHVDALSRYAVFSINDDSLVRLRCAQLQDDELKVILDVLREKTIFNDYFTKGGILYKLVGDDELIVVPTNMQREVIRKAHDNGHFAVKKTMELITKDYYIPKIDEKIQRHIANCIPCIISNRKLGKQEGELHILQKGEIPLQTYHVDFLGPLESTSKLYKHIFAVIDGFTKFCWLYPTKTTSAKEVIKRLHIQNAIFGNPVHIISDRGAAFTSDDFQNYCEAEGIKHHTITTGLPRANGQIERLNAVISSVLAKLSADDPSKWYKHVEKVQQAINSTYTRSTKTTPFELMIGVKMRKKEDIQLKQLIEDEMILHFQDERNELRQNAKREILKLQAENRKSYNRKRKPASLYNRGDLVAIKRTQFGVGLKLKPKYLGPYEVRSIKSNGTYDVLKIGLGDGPKTTTTCAEYMKPWSISSDDDSIAFGPNAQQDGRVVGMVDNNPG